MHALLVLIIGLRQLLEKLVVDESQIELHVVANDWLVHLRQLLNDLAEPNLVVEQFLNLLLDLKLLHLLGFIFGLFLFLLLLSLINLQNVHIIAFTHVITEPKQRINEDGGGGVLAAEL